MADSSSSSSSSNVQGQGQGQRRQQNNSFFSQILQSLVMYFIISTAFSFFKNKTIINNSSSKNDNNNNDNNDYINSNNHINEAITQINKPTELQTKFMGVNPTAKLPVFPLRDSEGRKLGNHKCLFKKGIELDFFLYVTENEDFDYHRDSNNLIWNISNIPYNSSFIPPSNLNLNFTITNHMYTNGSVTAHVFFAKKSSPIDTLNELFDSNNVAYQKFNLIRYRKKKIPKKTYKLLETLGSKQVETEETNLLLPSSINEPQKQIGSIDTIIDEKEVQDVNVIINSRDNIENSLELVEKNNQQSEEGQIVSYWVPTLDLALIEDMPESFGRNTIPAPILQHLSFNENGNYYPVIYHNDFFLTTKNLIEVNHTISEVPLRISISFMSFLRWHMQSQMEQSWKQQQAMGTGSERDTDMIREVLFDTNPWLLGITFAVSLLHMLFDFLAFKNDIQFWRKKKSMAGTSVQSLAVNCFFQTVIFLYLMDNDTSWMILFSSGIGLCIEYWKVTKAFNVTFHRKTTVTPTTSSSSTTTTTNQESSKEVVQEGIKFKIVDKIFGIPLPFIMKWKLSDSYTTSKTREYDAIATTHLLYAVIPIVFGYSIYSLIHNSHKSFYSWFLGSLVGFVYAFGFVLMTPQSVAHMPWKAMVYKSLNTFIDDLFAFVIKMPIMHRIACFRDDIIFFIYLYQRWIYAVDMNRVNEFGQGGTDDENQEQIQEGENKENNESNESNESNEKKEDKVDEINTENEEKHEN